MRLLPGIAAGIAALLIAPVPALADTPLETPGNLQIQHVSDTAADLSWFSSSLTSGDVVQRNVNGSWQTYATGRFSFLALTGLTPATTYSFRVFSIPVSGLGYTNSAPSAPITFTTLSGPDTAPPGKPPTPTFSSVTTTVATISWAPATDNVEVTGYYLQQLTGGAWTTIRTVGANERFQGLFQLSPATGYTYGVIAFDARGNTSPRSDSAVLTTLPITPNPVCQLQMITFGQSYLANVTIINTTAAPLTGWTLRFTLPPGSTVNYSFNGTVSRDGSAATIVPAIWNTTIGPGGSTFPGFSGQAPVPTGFTLNGLPCTMI